MSPLIPSTTRPAARPTARNKAIQYLAMREHSYLELSRKLQQKGYEDAEIDHALSKLIEDNLLSDERFGEAFVRSRVSKGQGPVRIRMELRDKGLNDFQIEQSFQANIEIDWDKVLETTWRKKYTEIAENANEKAKQWRFLQYRGFTPTQITQLFRRISSITPSEY